MDSERWEQIQGLFHKAISLPEAERRNFLEAACGGDTDVLAETLAMLDSDQSTGSLLDGGLASIASFLQGAPSEDRKSVV